MSAGRIIPNSLRTLGYKILGCIGFGALKIMERISLLRHGSDAMCVAYDGPDAERWTGVWWCGKALVAHFGNHEVVTRPIHLSPWVARLLKQPLMPSRTQWVYASAELRASTAEADAKELEAEKAFLALAV